jgi:hypothetical protein
MKRILLLPILLALMVVSGCVIPGTDIEIPFVSDLFGSRVEEFRHDVIVIQSLHAAPSTTLRSGQTLKLQAYVKNMQKPESEPQKNVRIILFNDCGLFDVTQTLCTGGSKGTEGEGCVINTMYPQSTAIVEWSMQAKDVKIKTPCKIGVLAQYDYVTYTTSSVTFINQEELERLVSQGKGVTERGVIIVGEGPIKSYIEIPDQPIVVDTRKVKRGKEAGSGIMTFWVMNKGTGHLAAPPNNNVDFESECGELERITGTGGTQKKICIHLESAKETGKNLIVTSYKDSEGKEHNDTTIQDCIEYKVNGTLSLIGRSSPKYSCEIYLEDPTRIKQEKTYQITSEIKYSYKFTKEIELTIEPIISL